MKQKLYIKKENGRYEEVKRPEVDNALYKRVGNRYVPMEIHLDSGFNWQEGVFAVTKNHSATGPDHWVGAEYLQEIFKLYRCGDIERVSIGKLAGMEKLANYLTRHWDETKGLCVYDQCAKIVAILMRYEEELENNK